MKKTMFLILGLGMLMSMSAKAQTTNDSIAIVGSIPVMHKDAARWIQRYQDEIDSYAKANDQLKDKSCDVLFLGSSSIVKWDNIDKDLAPLKIIRRSYGGAAIRDMLYNYNTIARGFHPQQIVLYVENDLSNAPEDLSVGDIYDHFRLFAQKIKQDYPGIPFYIMSFKPSKSRWVMLDKQKAINALLKDYAAETPDVYYIDITKGMYDNHGKLKTDIWLDDYLHMNEKGYAIWTKEIKPVLMDYKTKQEYSHLTTPTGKWQLVWDDEFNYKGLPDSTKWNFETAGNKDGWGNNEDEYYTDRDSTNAYVNHGVLTITARQKKNLPFGRKYTSARLNTTDKGDWLYGRFEVRAKLPTGRGTWPAIWMLSTDWSYGGWPESGELDIMENVGFMPDTLVFSAHSKAYNHIIGTQKTKRILYPNTSDQYHVYALEWDKNQIRYYVDSTLALIVNNEHQTFAEWPFDKRFHLLLNYAVGGFWGGAKGIDNSIFPSEFKIDYVRVYQEIK